jgi:ankyrin repeat protein
MLYKQSIIDDIFDQCASGTLNVSSVVEDYCELSDMDNRNLLEVAVQHANYDIAHELLKYKHQYFLRQYRLNNILNLAVLSGNREMIQLILDGLEDRPGCTGYQPQNALFLACQNGFLEICHMLMSKFTYGDDMLLSAVKAASRSGHIHIVRDIYTHHPNVFTSISDHEFTNLNLKR